MTKEEKELLFKDLCARLPYGVKVETYWNFKDKKEKTFPVMTLTNDMLGYYIGYEDYNFRMHYRPFLRPMSSMTEEEDKEYVKIIIKSQDCSYANNESSTTMVNDWYLSKGFDVRGLIPKGLALEAPEGMYKTE